MWAVQTPQAFRAEALRRALAQGDPSSATDDAMLVERAGGRVAIHPSPEENLKVTTPLDLRHGGGPTGRPGVVWAGGRGRSLEAGHRR